MSDNEITMAEYRAEVESTAESILDGIQEYPEDYDDDPWGAIHETVDSHQWIIYTAYHLDILYHAENEPEEWQVYVEDDETDHRKVIEAMAYTAFRADVSQRVFEMAEERGIDLR